MRAPSTTDASDSPPDVNYPRMLCVVLGGLVGLVGCGSRQFYENGSVRLTMRGLASEAEVPEFDIVVEVARGEGELRWEILSDRERMELEVIDASTSPLALGCSIEFDRVGNFLYFGLPSMQTSQGHVSFDSTEFPESTLDGRAPAVTNFRDLLSDVSVDAQDRGRGSAEVRADFFPGSGDYGCEEGPSSIPVDLTFEWDFGAAPDRLTHFPEQGPVGPYTPY